MRERTAPSRIVGILGGMGPAATVDFYDKLVRATPAARDQDHLRVAIWADPTVPNRQEALLAGGVDPTPWLERGVHHLIECGAEILIAPCNSVHAYLPAVVHGKDVEFISIIDATVAAVMQVGPSGKVGLLATDGALASGLYQSALRDSGLETVVPSAPTQKNLMDVIYGVKAGDVGPAARQHVLSLVAQLRADGVATVIAGCTEISTLLAGPDVDDVIDPSQVLALATIDRARSAPAATMTSRGAASPVLP